MSCCLTAGTAPIDIHQAAQTRRVNSAALRWPMQPTRAQTHSHRASRVIAALLLLIATTFVMHPMLGRPSRQLKMPRPDA